MAWKDLEIIFEAVDCGVCIMDAAGTMIKINPGLTRHTGLPANVFQDKPILSLYDHGYFAHLPIGYRGLTQARTIRGIQKTSSGKTLSATASPVFGPVGKLKYVVLDARETAEPPPGTQEPHTEHALGAKPPKQFPPSGPGEHGYSDIITRSEAMTDILRIALRAAATDATVLLMGESGVGKDLVAEFIWKNSHRFGRRGFLRLNCNSMPRDLVESELFGYAQGAFTGARKDGKPGLLEVLSGGTLVLDEIADLPVEVQGKFLDVLEKGAFRRLGGTKYVYTDVRIIAATNRNLKEMVHAGLFRNDLYYRLNVVCIRIPPLRARPEDVTPLTEHFLDRFNRKYRTHKALSADTMHVLKAYHWPGNVRELSHFLESLVITMSDDLIEAKALPSIPTGAVSEPGLSVLREPLKEALEEVEKRILAAAKREHGTSRRIGEALGISHTTVNTKLKKYRLLD